LPEACGIGGGCISDASMHNEPDLALASSGAGCEDSTAG